MPRTRDGQLMTEFLHDDTWDFNGVDTQYATHGLHTYLAAMIPQLAHRLIEMYVPPRASILDPFCGGGAVLVESLLNGRHATGRDINDLAVLISKAKTTHVPQAQIADTRAVVLEQALHYRGEPLSFAPTDHVDYWFKPEAMPPLTALRRAIDEIADDQLNTLFSAIFSATVRDVSLTYRNEIRLRRMTEEELGRFNPNVFERFDNRARVAELQVGHLPQEARADVGRADARAMEFADDQFTAIVCSPPYGDERNGVPYIQFSRNMLMWLGFTRDEVMEAKADTLGWAKKDNEEPPSNTLSAALAAIEHNPTAYREALAFYDDYHRALKEMVRVTAERIVIVIGQRVLSGTIFDNASITVDLMVQLGASLEARHRRKLPTKRLPKMREFGAAIDTEHILVFRK